MHHIIEMYYSYSNDFLTVEAFAEYYSLQVEQARLIIEWGRDMVNNKDKYIF